jgi:flagellar hook-associated protein 3 FlgL
MATRIGDLGHSQRQTASLLAVQSRLREAQLAAGSGRAASRWDQIADRAGTLLRLEDARAATATLAAQGERFAPQLQVMDHALGQIVAVADRMRAALVQRLDGGLGDQVPLDALIDTMLPEVARALNTRHRGQYLFAGSRTDVAPVVLPASPPTVPDPALYYRGDMVRLSIRADLELELPYGVTADAAPFARLIAGLGQARAAHLADDRAGLAGAMAEIEAALGGVAQLRAEVGFVAERLEATTESQRSVLLYLDELTSGIRDADLAAVLTRIAQDRVSLEAAYSVTGALASLSLANYLR